MDPRDRPRPLPDGARCTACGAAVPSGRIGILAQRDDVAFVELDCPACDSTTLGLLIAPPDPDGSTVLDLVDDAPADGPASGSPGRFVATPITDADVEALRNDLAAWDGDLVGWLATLDRDDRRGSITDR